MRVLLDTNILLDVLLNREPWVNEARQIWLNNDTGQLDAYSTASTLTDIFYVARRIAGLEKARAAIRICLDAFAICPVDRMALEQAAALSGNDFEDNLQIVCARINGLDAIVTRDKAGFSTTSPLILSPSELLAR